MNYQAKVVGRKDVPSDSVVILDHSRLDGTDYSGRKLIKFAAIGARLERCRFNGVRIEDASFGSGRETSEYIDCQFDGMRFLHGAGAARFVRCSFRDVELRNWTCNRTELIDCTFTGRLRKAIFSGTVPPQFRADTGRERNEFRGNDFSGMELIDVTFRTGIDLTQQQLPTGPQYLYVPDASAALENARAVVLSWPDSEHRKTAMLILTGLSEEVKDGQQQLFLRPAEWSGYGSFTPEGVEKVFALLAGKSV